MANEEAREDNAPKTKTEASGGGRPPRKTRIGTGEGGSGSGRGGEQPAFGSGGFKRSLVFLEVEANQILKAMKEEWTRCSEFCNSEENKDLCELPLLHKLLDFVIEEIKERVPYESRAREIILRLEKAKHELRMECANSLLKFSMADSADRE